jgi:hypothetical protein
MGITGECTSAVLETMFLVVQFAYQTRLIAEQCRLFINHRPLYQATVFLFAIIVIC